MGTPDNSKLGFGARVAAPAGASLLYQNNLGLLAGEYLAQRDLCALNSLDGKAYRVRTTDGASLASTTAVSLTVNSTNQDQPYSRAAICSTSDGFTLFAGDQNASGGIRVTKIATGGSAPLVSADIDTTAAQFHNLQVVQLASGNYLVIGITGTTQKFAIIDANLQVVTALATLAEGGANPEFGVCALSAGGFAVVYQLNGTPLVSRFVTYDNVGAVVTSPTTIWTRTGTSGMQCHRIAQLSNGNVLVTSNSSNTTSGFGLFYGIVTITGTSVLAFTSYSTVGNNNANATPELCVATGYFALAWPNGTNQLAGVFNNAGTLQGGNFSSSTANVNPNVIRLVTDGTSFLLFWQNTTNTSLMATKLPITGTGYTTVTINSTSNAYTNSINNGLDAFYENGNAVYGVGNTNLYVGAVQFSNLRPVVPLLNTGAACSGLYLRMLSAGDNCYAAAIVASTPAHVFISGKYAANAVLGVAAKDTPTGLVGSLFQNAGAYQTNLVGGSASKPFDFSAAAACYGNKGTMLPYAVVLKGM